MVAQAVHLEMPRKTIFSPNAPVHVTDEKQNNRKGREGKLVRHMLLFAQIHFAIGTKQNSTRHTTRGEVRADGGGGGARPALLYNVTLNIISKRKHREEE